MKFTLPWWTMLFILLIRPHQIPLASGLHNMVWESAVEYLVSLIYPQVKWSDQAEYPSPVPSPKTLSTVGTWVPHKIMMHYLISRWPTAQVGIQQNRRYLEASLMDLNFTKACVGTVIPSRPSGNTLSARGKHWIPMRPVRKLSPHLCKLLP